MPSASSPTSSALLIVFFSLSLSPSLENRVSRPSQHSSPFYSSGVKAPYSHPPPPVPPPKKVVVSFVHEGTLQPNTTHLPLPFTSISTSATSTTHTHIHTHTHTHTHRALYNYLQATPPQPFCAPLPPVLFRVSHMVGFLCFVPYIFTRLHSNNKKQYTTATSSHTHSPASQIYPQSLSPS